MKKITLVLTLFAFTFSFAQTIPVNFDADITVGSKSDGIITPADANWFSDSGLTSVAVEDLAADTPDHGNAGKIVSSALGAKWQNAQLLMKDNYIDLTTNKIISLDVYSDNPQDFLLKMEQPKDGITGNTEKSFSHGGTGWESFSVDFNTPNANQPVPNDQYKLFVIFPCYSAGFTDPAFDSTTYIDNFSGTVGDAILPPAAPTSGAPAPTIAAADAYGLFGDTYTENTPTAFSQSWAVGTVSDYDTGSGMVKKYEDLNYQAINLASTVDLSNYTHIHVDVWTPNANAFGLKLQDFGADDTDEYPNVDDSESQLASSTTQSSQTWVGHDFAIADFTDLTGTANLGQIQVVLGALDGGTQGDVYIDNLFIYNDPADTATTTTVTVDVSENLGGVNIISNQNNWVEAPAVDNGDGTYSYTFENVAEGTVIEYKWVLYTSAVGTFEDLLPLVAGGGVDNDLAANLPTNETIVTNYSSYCNRSITASTTNVVAQTYFFNSFRQPGVDYPELVVTAPAGDNLVIDYSANAWSEYHGPGAVDNGDGTHTVLVDPSSAFEYKWVNTTTGVTEDLLTCDNSDENINTDNSTYANRVHAAGEDHDDVFGACPIVGPTTSAQTPPARAASDVVSLYSDAYTNSTNWGDIDVFGGSLTDVVVDGDNTYKMTSGFQYNYYAPGGTFEDLSDMTHMHVDFYVDGDVTLGQVLGVQLIGGDSGENNYYQIPFQANTWVSTDVLLADFTNAAPPASPLYEDVKLIQVNLQGPPPFSTVYLDNFYFYRDLSAGLDDNVLNAVKMFPNPAKDTVQFSVNSNENLDIEIFDMLGKSVLRVDNVRNAVNVSELNSGLYFVQMTLGTQKSTKKLVIN